MVALALFAKNKSSVLRTFQVDPMHCILVHVPLRSVKYSLLPNKRAGGKKSDRRRVWHFMERVRRPRERCDPKGCSVWDFM